MPRLDNTRLAYAAQRVRDNPWTCWVLAEGLRARLVTLWVGTLPLTGLNLQYSTNSTQELAISLSTLQSMASCFTRRM